MRKVQTKTSIYIPLLVLSCLLTTGCWRASADETVALATLEEARTAGLDARADALAEQEAELAEKARALEEVTSRLAEQQEALEAEEEELARRDRELTRRLATLDERLKDLERAAADARRPPPTRPAAAPSAAPKPEARPEPPASPPARPQQVAIEVPAGTPLDLEILQELGSSLSRPGDTFRARLRSDLRVDGVLLAAAGSEVLGQVTEAEPLRQVGGRARLAFELTDLIPSGGRRAAILAYAGFEGRKEGKRDAITIAAAAGAGAILGRILDGDEKTRGTLIGAAAGAAAGTAYAARDQREILLPAGEVLRVELAEPASVLPPSP